MFNLVHSRREVVDTLLTHPKVRAVSFVGSTSVALAVYETATRHGKRVQSNGCTKNYVVIMPAPTQTILCAAWSRQRSVARADAA